MRDIKINLGYELSVRRVSLENQNFNQPFLPAGDLIFPAGQGAPEACARFVRLILSRLSGTATISLFATVRNSKEDFRSNLTGKTINDYIIVQLDKAFDSKELEFILNDLGLDKNDPAAAQKHFKIQITKIGLLEKRELNEDFFSQLYPGHEVKTEADFRNKVKDEIQAYWNNQARNQIHDQVFHELTDHTSIQFPEGFLKKWVKTQGASEENTKIDKSDEQVEKEFPVFLNQLKWTLITDKIVRDNAIQVNPDEIREFAKQQLFGYMGGSGADVQDQPWVNDYVEKMMKDRKYMEEAYTRIQTQKIFEWADSQVNPVDNEISAEEFTKMVEAHQHHHH